MTKRTKKRSPKTILKLPDLEHSIAITLWKPRLDRRAGPQPKRSRRSAFFSVIGDLS